MKKIFFLIVITVLLLPVYVMAADPYGIFDVAEFSLPTGKPPLEVVIATIIGTILSVLGVIALVMIIYAGFQWMTASGNEEKITNAKKGTSWGSNWFSNSNGVARNC